eukprot:763056-Hanusia_phi.AAC.6
MSTNSSWAPVTFQWKPQGVHRSPMIFALFATFASFSSLRSGMETLPTVQAFTSSSHTQRTAVTVRINSAEGRVDFPTLGMPTIPHDLDRPRGKDASSARTACRSHMRVLSGRGGAGIEIGGRGGTRGDDWLRSMWLPEDGAKDGDERRVEGSTEARACRLMVSMTCWRAAGGWVEPVADWGERGKVRRLGSS